MKFLFTRSPDSVVEIRVYPCESLVEFPRFMLPLKLVHQVAKETGLAKHAHLWPDKSLGAAWVAESMPHPGAYKKCLQLLWTRISEWPATELPR